MQSNTASGMTDSTALPSSIPPVSSITNTNVTNIVNQNSNMPNVAGMLQDSSRQQGLSSNMFSGSQRPNVMPSQQTQSAQYLYQKPQQLLSSQVGNSSLQTNQHSMHMLTQPNLLQQDVEQRQLYQPQRTFREMPSSLLDSTALAKIAHGVDWQEEVFQKIKAMKDAYLPELTEIYQRVVAILQQDSVPQQQRSNQFGRLKEFKTLLERLIQFLSVSKSSINPELKDKVAIYEKQIIQLINIHGLKKTVPVQQGQLPQSQMQPMLQPQSQNGLSTLQSNVNQPQLSSNLLQQQHLKQQQDQQMTQQQFQQQRHMQQQLQQKQQLIQQQQQQQQLQARQRAAQNDMNDLTAKQGMNVSRGMFQPQRFQQFKSGSQLAVSSPQLLQGTSPQMTQQHLSPQVDQKNVSSINKMGTPLQPAYSPFIVPSPSTSMAPSPMQVDSEKPSGASTLSMGNNARRQATGNVQLGLQTMSASPLLQEFTSPDGNNLNPLTNTSTTPSTTELPIERLIRAVKSLSPEALSSAVSDIRSVVSMVDRIAGSAPGNGSRASVGEDLVAMTKSRGRDFMTQEGMMATKKMKRHITAIASLGGSIGDNYKQFAVSETEAEHALLEEINEINQRMVDTVVEISDEDASNPSKGREGKIVMFLFKAVSVSPALKALMPPIKPLRLLVPCTYPNDSPSLLDKPLVESSIENEDLSSKAMARFNINIRCLSPPMSLKDMAKTWDDCVRAVICEYAQQFGGGTFSSKYGAWKTYEPAS